MASSNQVRIALIKETVYGTTPGAGNFNQLRFTSEGLSGSPETTESALIRTDRLSSGQIVTGLTVGGAINTELAVDAAFEELMESAMFNTWQTSAAVVVDLSINAGTLLITRASGDWNADVFVGAVLTLTGFVNGGNNTQVMVAAINSATIIRVIAPEGLVTEVGSGTDFQVADYLTIGTKTSRVSHSVEKAFLDLTTKAINYTGMIVNNMTINAAYGAIVTATFELNGNGYETADLAAEFMTDGRTINNPATTNPLNGSVDMPFLANSASGTFEESTFCIQSIEMSLNNNLTPQTCIGQVAPDEYTEGTAQITINLNAYVTDDNWALLESKLAQTPIQIGYLLKNSSGYYGIYMPAVQLSFEDPQSGGQNQDVFLNTSGVAKVGANGESALYLFRA